jgi:hypothetical protein
VGSAVLYTYNWRSQSVDMRQILQLNGLNVSSELGVTVVVMDVTNCVREVLSSVVPGHSVKAQRGSRGIAPLIRNIGYCW